MSDGNVISLLKAYAHNTHTHTSIKITHQTCMNNNITDETTKQ